MVELAPPHARHAVIPRWVARLRPWAVPALLLVVLEWYARTIASQSDAIAPPSAALLAFARAASDGSLATATAFTLRAAALGLVVGALLAVPLGLLLGLSRRAAASSFLTVELLRPIPSVALIPIAMLVFGFGLRMELAIVAFATFWPLLVLTQSAVRQLEPQLLEVAAALQLSPRKRTLSIVLPAIMPRLFVALRQGVAIALVVSVTVEIGANPNGMGYALMLSQQSLDPAGILAWLAWIGVLGFAINALALRLQRALARRMGESAP